MSSQLLRKSLRIFECKNGELESINLRFLSQWKKKHEVLPLLGDDDIILDHTRTFPPPPPRSPRWDHPICPPNSRLVPEVPGTLLGRISRAARIPGFGVFSSQQTNRSQSQSGRRLKKKIQSKFPIKGEGIEAVGENELLPITEKSWQHV